MNIKCMFMQNIPTQNNGFESGVFVCMVSSVGCVCENYFNFFNIVCSL